MASVHASLAWKSAWEGMVEMRRHYGNYLRGLPDVKDARLRLCTERDPAILEEILDEACDIYSVEVLATA